MTEHDLEKPANPLLLGATPQLFVADLPASCAFFGETLGFTVEFAYGDPPFYAQVKRGGAQIALRHVDQDVMEKVGAAMKADVDMLAASISVDDVGRLFDEFRAANVAFHQTLRTEPWGARTFIVADPDGNLLLFAGD